MNPYARLIPRLNGLEIEERFAYYKDLVKSGVAGFIVFGGELNILRRRIREFQAQSEQPLIIAADLEQGLGQQVRGGTLFPPAMAIAHAVRNTTEPEAFRMLESLYVAFAAEAQYAGINTILAPVLDINTNPDNPIIATRAFGEDPETVSSFGCTMVQVLGRNGITTCGKHFPGHGDTDIDSHIRLPVITKDIHSLEKHELIPFRRAIHDGISMIMLGHLSVPALDPSGRPASLSEPVVGYLRRQMGFRGLTITDAMNMGGIGDTDEDEACLTALHSGVDLILHPSDPHRTAALLRSHGCTPENLAMAIDVPDDRALPDFDEHQRLSRDLTKAAVSVTGDIRIRNPFVVIITDDVSDEGIPFVTSLRQRFPHIRHICIYPTDAAPGQPIPPDSEIIVCIFSSVKAWKADRRSWLLSQIRNLRRRASLFISFGNPYVLREIEDVPRISAFWGSASSQEAVADLITAV